MAGYNIDVPENAQKANIYVYRNGVAVEFFGQRGFLGEQTVGADNFRQGREEVTAVIKPVLETIIQSIKVIEKKDIPIIFIKE